MPLRADPACPDCKGRGIVANEAGEERGCHCLKQTSGGGSDKEAGIPPKYHDRTFYNFHRDSPDRKAALKAAKDWADRFESDKNPDKTEQNGLLLWGGVGSGKTHLAVAAFKIAMEAGLHGFFWNASEFLQGVREGFSNNNERNLIDEASTCDILLLDDLGTHRNTDFAIEQLYLVINRRHQSLLPTIVTTNIEKTALIDEFDERIASRLFEMCHFVHVKCGDYRMSNYK